MNIESYLEQYYIAEYLIQNTVPDDYQAEFLQHRFSNPRFQALFQERRTITIPRNLPPVENWRFSDRFGLWNTFSGMSMWFYIPDLFNYHSIYDIIDEIKKEQNTAGINGGGNCGSSSVPCGNGVEDDYSSDVPDGNSSDVPDGNSSDVPDGNSWVESDDTILDIDGMIEANDSRAVKAYKQIRYLIKNVINKLYVGNKDSMLGLFSENRFLTSDIQIESWNVNNVKSMKRMFARSNFNGKLDAWGYKTRNVIDMEGMFYDNRYFNQPINNWNVQSVKNMSEMFYKATSFNQPINDWNVQNVEDMHKMFYCATRFNKPLNKWKHRDGGVSVESMFFGADNFNQPIKKWKLQNLRRLYHFLPLDYNQDLSNWKLNDNQSYYREAEESHIFSVSKELMDKIFVGENMSQLHFKLGLSKLHDIHGFYHFTSSMLDGRSIDFFTNVDKVKLFPQNMDLNKIPIFRNNTEILDFYKNFRLSGNQKESSALIQFFGRKSDNSGVQQALADSKLAKKEEIK